MNRPRATPAPLSPGRRQRRLRPGRWTRFTRAGCAIGCDVRHGDSGAKSGQSLLVREGPRQTFVTLGDTRLHEEVRIGFDHRVHRYVQRVNPLVASSDVFVCCLLPLQVRIDEFTSIGEGW